jgi:8-oxo-dGTP pyrophosphatase MutT (NUDIX family)
MRDAADGLEVLLLRRSPLAAFVPGAYVFPGGLVDPGDATPEAIACIEGLTPERAAVRLGLVGTDPPAIAYYVAAVREAFEETGILVGSRRGSSSSEVRTDLLAGRIPFAVALTRLSCRVDGGGIAYFAHWITPERSPRRYDTRFFAAQVTGELEPVLDEREMTEALWITPGKAAQAHSRGSLPMILPTVRTLERLAGFPDAKSALAELATAPVRTVFPAPGAGGFAGPLAEVRLPG